MLKESQGDLFRDIDAGHEARICTTLCIAILSRHDQNFPASSEVLCSMHVMVQTWLKSLQNECADMLADIVRPITGGCSPLGVARIFKSCASHRCLDYKFCDLLQHDTLLFCKMVESRQTQEGSAYAQPSPAVISHSSAVIAHAIKASAEY